MRDPFKGHRFSCDVILLAVHGTGGFPSHTINAVRRIPAIAPPRMAFRSVDGGLIEGFPYLVLARLAVYLSPQCIHERKSKADYP